MTILELSPGGGWWTEILAPYARAYTNEANLLECHDSNAKNVILSASDSHHCCTETAGETATEPKNDGCPTHSNDCQGSCADCPYCQVSISGTAFCVAENLHILCPPVNDEGHRLEHDDLCCGVNDDIERPPIA